MKPLHSFHNVLSIFIPVLFNSNVSVWKEYGRKKTVRFTYKFVSQKFRVKKIVKRSCSLLPILLLLPICSYAWDPIGDLTHPDRIIRNFKREINNAGRKIDKARLEAMVQAGAPAFQQWLIQSRNDSSRGSMPIPDNVAQQLRGFYSDNVLRSVRFKVDDPGVFNLSNLSIQYGGASAVTLIDVIVFKFSSDAYNNLELWAHELQHVKQFRDWGVRKFAIRYLRSWNSVENAAYKKQDKFVSWSRRQLSQRFQFSRSQTIVNRAGFPSGTPMQSCGCWGPPLSPEAIEPRCASGRVQVTVCRGQGMCAPGHPVYGYTCR